MKFLTFNVRKKTLGLGNSVQKLLEFRFQKSRRKLSVSEKVLEKICNFGAKVSRLQSY